MAAQEVERSKALKREQELAERMKVRQQPAKTLPPKPQQPTLASNEL